jgi:predicted dinucleotide-binding enzyme
MESAATGRAAVPAWLELDEMAAAWTAWRIPSPTPRAGGAQVASDEYRDGSRLHQSAENLRRYPLPNNEPLYRSRLMKIGIIGAGHIGGTLTRRLSALGHDISVANSRGPESLAELTKATGTRAVTVREAATGKDVVIVTIPEKSVPELPRGLFAANDDVVVVDTGNYYPQRDGRIAAIEDGLPESKWVEQQLGRPVIKAFNTIHAKDLMERGRAADQGGRIALPVAGDDAAAKRVVLQLVEELGFDGVDAGSLEESWRQQPGTPVYGTNLERDPTQRALANAPRSRPQGYPATRSGVARP